MAPYSRPPVAAGSYSRCLDFDAWCRQKGFAVLPPSPVTPAGAIASYDVTYSLDIMQDLHVEAFFGPGSGMLTYYRTLSIETRRDFYAVFTPIMALPY